MQRLDHASEEVVHERMDIALSVVVTLLLTLVNGFFSMSEMALSTAKKVVLEHEAEEGDRRAQKAAEVSGDSGGFLAAIQVAITLVGFFSSAFAATNLSEPLAAWMMGVGVGGQLARPLSTVLITLVVSYFSIVVGELVPKRMAMADSEGMAKRVAGPIATFSMLARPVVLLTAASANGLATLLHIKSADDRQEVSEDEIRYMVTDSGELTEQEKSMIHDVIDLGDTVAREVMVPRVDMCAIEDTQTCSEVLEVMRRTGLSRLPVYHEDVDRIVGIAHIKDIISPIVDEGAGNKSIGRYLRQASFVPDTKDIIPLLSEMQSSHDQMVIVVDEYGGTAGIITIEDIVEEVVGEIADEFDPDNKYLTQLSERGGWSTGASRSMMPSSWDGLSRTLTSSRPSQDTCSSWPTPSASGRRVRGGGLPLSRSVDAGRRLSMLRVTAPEPERDEAAGEQGR